MNPANPATCRAVNYGASIGMYSAGRSKRAHVEMSHFFSNKPSEATSKGQARMK